MLQNLLVGIALFAHDGGTDLAQPDAMTPASAVDNETGRHAVDADVLTFYGEVGALEVAVA